MRTNKGYILLEALVGVAILGIIVVSALTAVGANIAAVEEIRMQSEAVSLAQKKMEEIGGRDAFKTAETGDFGETWPAYKWTEQTSVVSATNWYTLANIKISVTYQVRGADRSVNLQSDFILRKPAVGSWN